MVRLVRGESKRGNGTNVGNAQKHPCSYFGCQGSVLTAGRAYLGAPIIPAVQPWSPLRQALRSPNLQVFPLWSRPGSDFDRFLLGRFLG